MTGKFPFVPRLTFDQQLEVLRAKKFNPDAPELKDVDARAKVGGNDREFVVYILGLFFSPCGSACVLSVS